MGFIEVNKINSDFNKPLNTLIRDELRGDDVSFLCDSRSSSTTYLNPGWVKGNRNQTSHTNNDGYVSKLIVNSILKAGTTLKCSVWAVEKKDLRENDIISECLYDNQSFVVEEDPDLGNVVVFKIDRQFDTEHYFIVGSSETGFIRMTNTSQDVYGENVTMQITKLPNIGDTGLTNTTSETASTIKLCTRNKRLVNIDNNTETVLHKIGENQNSLVPTSDGTITVDLLDKTLTEKVNLLLRALATHTYVSSDVTITNKTSEVSSSTPTLVTVMTFTPSCSGTIKIQADIRCTGTSNSAYLSVTKAGSSVRLFETSSQNYVSESANLSVTKGETITFGICLRSYGEGAAFCKNFYIKGSVNFTF